MAHTVGAWIVRIVDVYELSEVLEKLEETHPPASVPICIPHSGDRVLVIWRYWKKVEPTT